MSRSSVGRHGAALGIILALIGLAMWASAGAADEAATQPASADVGVVMTTPSGLKITVMAKSHGAANGDQVAVNYSGKLQDGTEFDNSYKRGEPIKFVLGQGTVIKGWEEGLLGMQVGEKRRLVIPPELGYGPNGQGPIPANATLIFDVELVGLSRGG
jgi:FKBP-type peptidyl-prolyl cis-trans isomerase